MPTTQALVHVDAATDQVRGVWAHDGTESSCFYPPQAREHRVLADELMTAPSWAEQLQCLAGQGQHMASWYPVPREPGETAAQVYERVSRAPVPVVHPWYLPFSRGQLLQHFAKVGGGGGTPYAHLRHYLESARRNLQHVDLVEHPRPVGSRLCHALDHQVEKDERFWVVSTLMSIFHSDDRVGRLTALLTAALGPTPPSVGDMGTWGEALGDPAELRLYFEVNLPAPPAYKLWLGEHQMGHNLLPYLIDKAAGQGLEGTTKVDAMLVAPGTGFAVVFEAKVLSDASSHTTYDATRNQLARNIDVLLDHHGTLQPPLTARCPERSFFVLLTPEVFKADPNSRLYGSLMTAYTQDRAALKAHLPYRSDTDLAGASKRLGWTTWEECRRILPGACGWLDVPVHPLAGAVAETPDNQPSSCIVCADSLAATTLDAASSSGHTAVVAPRSVQTDVRVGLPAG